MRDIERSTTFYTEILNFRVSDVNEQGMVFFTAFGDHHTVAIMQAPAGEAAEQPAKQQLGLSHFAMEVGSLDELFAIREFLKRRSVTITFEGRKGGGATSASSSSIPMVISSSCTGIWISSARPIERGRGAVAPGEDPRRRTRQPAPERWER